MPSPDAVLTSLAAIANDWRWLATGWHVVLAALLAVVLAGWRLSTRLVAHLLIASLLSVGLVAWLSSNPFNGTVFAVLAAILIGPAAGFSNEPACLARRARVAAAVAFIVSGSAYPHFLKTDSWTTYLYAAPFGLLPCPTLSVVIGTTLLIPNLRSNIWNTALVVAGLLYGTFGVWRLGVVLDWNLLLASATLAAAASRQQGSWRMAHKVESPSETWS